MDFHGTTLVLGTIRLLLLLLVLVFTTPAPARHLGLIIILFVNKINEN
jgi:hypothetical protein